MNSIKSWDEKWGYPQTFYGFCVPTGTTVNEIIRKKTQAGVVKDTWGKVLPEQFVFIHPFHNEDMFYTTCQNERCNTCEPVRKEWAQKRNRCFLWICIAR